MSFNLDNFSTSGSNARKGEAPQQYTFSSNTDTTLDMQAVGYFNDVSFHVSPTDAILAVGTNGMAIFEVILSDPLTNTVIISTSVIRQDPVPRFLFARDEKSSGTQGGTFIQDVWQIRDLNTVLFNSIENSSLSSNEITLPPGTYYFEISAPAFDVNRHKARLFNVTEDVPVLIGASSFINSVVSSSVTHSRIIGILSFSVPTKLRVEHFGEEGNADNGLGVESSFSGSPEVYTILKISKF